jgi:hypothetical protein
MIGHLGTSALWLPGDLEYGGAVDLGVGRSITFAPNSPRSDSGVVTDE